MQSLSAVVVLATMGGSMVMAKSQRPNNIPVPTSTTALAPAPAPAPVPIQINPSNIKFTYTGKEQIRIHASGPSVSQKSQVVAWFNSPSEKANLKQFSSGYGDYLVTDEKGTPIQDPLQSRKLQGGETRVGNYIMKKGQIMTYYIPTKVRYSSGQAFSFLITVGANIKELIINDGADWTKAIYDRNEKFNTFFKAIY